MVIEKCSVFYYGHLVLLTYCMLYIIRRQVISAALHSYCHNTIWLVFIALALNKRETLQLSKGFVEQYFCLTLYSRCDCSPCLIVAAATKVQLLVCVFYYQPFLNPI